MAQSQICLGVLEGKTASREMGQHFMKDFSINKHLAPISVGLASSPLYNSYMKNTQESKVAAASSHRPFSRYLLSTYYYVLGPFQVLGIQ